MDLVVDSPYWFGVSTKTIDLQKEIEDIISRDIDHAAQGLQGRPSALYGLP